MNSLKIKELREKAGLTQKELATKLFVTPQAVSRWEGGETEPSASTLEKLAEIFDVSMDELFGHDAPPSLSASEADPIAQSEPAPQTETTQSKDSWQNTGRAKETEAVYQTQTVLGVCERCKKPITDSDDYIVTHHSSRRSSHTGCICKSCDDIRKKTAYNNSVAYAAKCRKRSYWWSGFISAALFTAVLYYAISKHIDVGTAVGGCVVALLFFPFISCLFLDNNFVGDLFIRVCSFGFVRFPCLIFSLDLDGIIWLLTVKLFLWILGIILAVAFFFLAVAIGLLASIFVYPYALRKSIAHPELSE